MSDRCELYEGEFKKAEKFIDKKENLEKIIKWCRLEQIENGEVLFSRLRRQIKKMIEDDRYCNSWRSK